MGYVLDIPASRLLEVCCWKRVLLGYHRHVREESSRARIFWGDKSPGERSDGVAGQGPLRRSAHGETLLGRVAAELARHVAHAERQQAAAMQ